LVVADAFNHATIARKTRFCSVARSVQALRDSMATSFAARPKAPPARRGPRYVQDPRYIQGPRYVQGPRYRNPSTKPFRRPLSDTEREEMQRLTWKIFAVLALCVFPLGMLLNAIG
jgi:hypothetical protein